MNETTYLELAARLLGVDTQVLWDYREGHNGITVRTPDGYRHRYTFKELEAPASLWCGAFQSSAQGDTALIERGGSGAHGSAFPFRRFYD